jgi:hypothetical protein
MMSAMSRPFGEIIFAVEETPEGGYLARRSATTSSPRPAA